ncbi:hypothetical protein U1Q18_008510 [Sarracenia purpurea var. burkii]
MAEVEISHIDLECGSRSSAGSDGGGGGGGGSDDESICFSDADEGSCYSQFYSTADGSYDDYSFSFASDPDTGGVSFSRSASAAAAAADYVENGIREVKVHLGSSERDCRICQLSLQSPNPESGIAIELGCSCKDDLAAVHKNCAETWFKIKGNKTCEICNSVARNVFGAHDIESTQQMNDINATTTTAASASVPPSAETQSRLNGHRFVNVFLACMVFAFFISWLFHFNIRS